MAKFDEDKMKLVQDMEIEMMTDMYDRLTKSCHKRCIPSRYLESDLQKGEGICLDRCVAKYLEVHDRIGKTLQSISLSEQAAPQGPGGS